MFAFVIWLGLICILFTVPGAKAFEWQGSTVQGVPPQNVKQHPLFRVEWRADLPWSWYESRTAGKPSPGLVLGAGVWRGGDRNPGELFITPELRYEWAATEQDLQWFVEAGVGRHVLSRTDYAKGGAFSTAFQFGEQLGAGVRFGEKKTQDLMFLYKRGSNTDIKIPNYGADFFVLKYGFKM
ncbi:acyloxyacyl hydrolase [Iodobacter ciconiae]|uniref:Acyloxyacyl hydrolase n=1 Tax=Iodobacter ciconiae TaxID=2496266 RepID=A0A3S8ZU39_9NEIS|nr:acyloxyacyl hydrolase [Iodobacter ciconiae]AZN36969.1 acyloxyacyl hydrolase [Iodobacter ciconiae]